jgi:hypothetical protein
MKKNILIVCIVFITLINVFIFIYIKKQNLNFDEKLAFSLENIESIVSSNTLRTYQSQNEIIDNVLLVNNNDMCHLNDLVKDNSIFVFILPTHACQSCIYYCSNSINQYLTKEFISKKVIVFNIGVKDDYYKTPNLIVKNYSVQGKLNIPLEKDNVPFFFIVDNEMKAKMLFIPDKRLPRQTEAYFESLKSYFSK